ncbi:DUF4199 family protein [Flavihumibacter sp. RY-1]|uniref:DUF4199 family protein n=1 Tax=Flavihumibacter fluminis TaxID=2909236 RepID=A0ABS9BCE7_9BACT|nr:DUF4199 family protein [Flavihumibacter fluminis]MCF1713309.1 DUF4199 family protein [Flavihumibacter fluminis]
MKKIVLVFGIIIGLVFCANIGFMVYWMYHNPDLKGSEFVGYSVMVVVFSLIYIGVRNYRNKQLDGFISFGSLLQSLGTTSLITYCRL